MRTLKINLLYNCTAKCSHCRFNCENESEPTMPDFETPYVIAEKLKDNFGLDMAVILGGEPSIYKEETINLLQKLSSLGITTRLETNASWANSYDEAIAFLSPLKILQTNVMLSLDGFHDPFIPLVKVANAINACIDLGVNYNLELPYLDVVQKDNDIDRKTDELFNSLSSYINCKLPKYEGGIIFTGRAADIYGDKFAAGKGIPLENCSAVPWWIDSDIKTTDLLILEPGGYITKGCGIAIGNVYKEDIIEMLTNYNANNHPIFSILLTEGPMGLAKLAVKYGYKIKIDYADKCHLCHESRQILKPYFDDILKPDQHYVNSY